MKKLDFSGFNANVMFVVEALAHVAGCDFKIAFATVMASISTASQGLANISLHAGDTRAISLAFLVIADSGMRKSAAWAHAVGPIEAYEAEQMNLAKSHRHCFEAKRDVFTAKHKALKAELAEAIKHGFDTSHIEDRLQALHERERPAVPDARRHVVNDATGRALDHVLTHSPSILLGSHEAAFLHMRQGQNLDSQFTQLWDGFHYKVDRRNRMSDVIREPRVTFLMMMQSGVFKKQFSGVRSGDDLGLLARFLISYSDRSEVPRHTLDVPENAKAILEAYGEKLKKLLALADTRSKACRPKVELTLSADAKTLLLESIESLRALSMHNGPLSNCVAMIEKSFELTARMAACIHVFNDPSMSSTEIPLSTIREALSMVVQYVNMSNELLGERGKFTDLMDLCEKLKAWAHKKVLQRGNPFMREVDGHFNLQKTFMLRNGPNALRTESRLLEVLDVLHQERIIIPIFPESDQEWCLSRHWLAEQLGAPDPYSGVASHVRRITERFDQRPFYKRKDVPYAQQLQITGSSGHAARP